MINSVNSKSGRVDLADVESISMSPDEASSDVAKFAAILSRRLTHMDAYISLRNSILEFFRYETIECVILGLISEGSAVYYTYYVG